MTIHESPSIHEPHLPGILSEEPVVDTDAVAQHIRDHARPHNYVDRTSEAAADQGRGPYASDVERIYYLIQAAREALDKATAEKPTRWDRPE